MQKKTTILFYNSHKNVIANFPDVYLNNSKIERVNEFKYLGLVIDTNLNWKSHIDLTIKKVRPYVGIFRKIAFYCGDNVKKSMYYSFFHSHISYLLSVWSGTSQGDIYAN